MVKTLTNAADLLGIRVLDCTGKNVGTIDEIYLDDATHAPEWATVRLRNTRKKAFVPLTTCETNGTELQVPYSRSLVEQAPAIAEGEHLSPAEEEILYQHYRGQTRRTNPPDGDAAAHDLPRPASAPTSTDDRSPLPHALGPLLGATTAQTAPDTGRLPRPPQDPTPDQPYPTAGPSPDTAAHADTASPTTDQFADPSRPIEITRHEEKIDISTRWQPRGTVSVRRSVVSEPVNHVIPLTRERVHVERIPIAAGETSYPREWLDLSDTNNTLVHEVALHEEHVVVNKRVVGVERIRLTVEQDTVQHTVQDELRKEQVEIRDTTAANVPPEQ
ncbi:PRC and DUF2382 domain-containing protein [Kitasatospora sp. NPDC086791]|uniref:PRC and DUF2382 domain-containing protein n=1 Tax=Kitasatospora sp. NPDC086791 TaxID=3155178 RepID=UPI003439A222